MSARPRHRPWFRDRRELADLSGLLGVPVESNMVPVLLAEARIAHAGDPVQMFPNEVTFVDACRQAPDRDERFYRPLRWLTVGERHDLAEQYFDRSLGRYCAQLNGVADLVDDVPRAGDNSAQPRAKLDASDLRDHHINDA